MFTTSSSSTERSPSSPFVTYSVEPIPSAEALLASPDEKPTPIVFVVDDDASTRVSLERIMLTEGLDVKAFGSGQQFLSHARAPVPSCLVLDVDLPDLSGLELQKRICGHTEMPIIFLTGCDDVRTTVAAMKAGAFEFLTKPFGDEVLLRAIRNAVERSRATLEINAAMDDIRARYSALSRREREVMGLVVSGLLNKQVGGELGISEITVKAHRGRVMRKMCAKTFVELVTMAARLRVAIGTDQP